MGRAQLSLLGFGWEPQNSLRGVRLEREVPEGGHRVAPDTQALRRLKQGAGGGGCQQKLSPSAERGERWRRAQAPTLARNEAAPGGSASLLPNPTPHAPPTPFLASSVCRPSGPPRKTQQGRRLAACKGGLAVGRHRHGVRRPTSTQHPRVSGASLPRRCPTSNSPRGAAPSPTSGRRPQRLRPRGPRSPR